MSDETEYRKAADNLPLPHAATTAGEFLNMIEDGQFSADLNAAMQDLAAQMSDMVQATGQQQKGKVTVEVEFSTEGGPIVLKAKFKVKAPEEKRRKTLVWTDEHNRFTRSQPRQGQFFGVREVVNVTPQTVRNV